MRYLYPGLFGFFFGIALNLLGFSMEEHPYIFWILLILFSITVSFVLN